MSMITQALAEFDEPKAAIAIVRQYANLTLVTDGIGKVEEAHKQVKRLRIDIEVRRKSLVEGAVKYQRAINAEAKSLTAEVEPIEDALWSQRQIHEAEKEKEKQAKEAAKQAVLQSRIEKLAQVGCTAGDIVALQAMIDDEFDLHLMRESAKAEQVRAEQEAARLEADRREAERFAEITRQADEMRVRAEEIAAERKAMEAEREAMLHQQALDRKAIEIQQAELDRQHEAIRFAEEQKAEAERQRLLAERKAEDDRLAAIAAEEAEVYRIAKLEALKPEIEKAQAFADAINAAVIAWLAGHDNPHWSSIAVAHVQAALVNVLSEVERG